MSFPRCAPDATPEFARALRDLGARWAADPSRPRVAPAVLDRWDALIEAWVAASEVPLLVRKSDKNRGALVVGPAGRALVPTDNSPAQWAFAVAHAGDCPDVGAIAPLLDAGRLPVAMAFTADERRGARFAGLLGKCADTSEAGWKLAHLDAVGLAARGRAESFPRTDLERHFRRFMSPRNMMVVPAAWAGLAEVPEFLAGFRQADSGRAAS